MKKAKRKEGTAQSQSVQSLSRVRLVSPRAVAHQAPLSMGFSKQVAVAFFRGAYQPRGRTQVSCNAGRFFTA